MWRPRMTTRRLMIAVAILAFAFGAIKWVADMRARSAAYHVSGFRRDRFASTSDGHPRGFPDPGADVVFFIPADMHRGAVSPPA